MDRLGFRAWCIPLKEYYYYVELYSYKDGSCGWSVGENNDRPVGNSDQFIIEQWTGRLDKHGKKIYDGDIISWSTTRYKSCYEGHDPKEKNELITIEWKSPVEWEDCGFVVTESFELDQKNNCWLCGVDGEIEIIGHIHES